MAETSEFFTKAELETMLVLVSTLDPEKFVSAEAKAVIYKAQALRDRAV